MSGLPIRLLEFSASAAMLAAGLSALLTWVAIRLSSRMRLVANPRADRWHRSATPNTGGIAIVLSSLAVYGLLGGGIRYAMLAGLAAAIAALGILDDRVPLHPAWKIAGQSAAAAMLIAHGVMFHHTRWEGVNAALTFLWIVGMTNAFNLIDNMDGLCAGVTVIICGFRFIVAAQMGDTEGALLLAILAGAFLGFLKFNYHRARIFMGDGGSMFAGFTLAALAVASPVPHARAFASALGYPALTFLYPIFDTALVSILRRLAGRPISVGGLDHSSHRLASLGLGERKVVWLLWGLTAVGSLAGLLTSWMPIGMIAIAALLLLGVSVLGIFLGTLPAYAMPEASPARLPWLRRRIPTLRAGVTLAVEVLLAGVALMCAFLLRWENSFLGAPMREFLRSLPVVMASHGVACLTLRSYPRGWRWFGGRDLAALAKSVVLGSALSVLALWMAGERDYSRGVVAIYALLLLAFSAGLRASIGLLWDTLAPVRKGPRTAVLGANRAGELAVLILQKQEHAGGPPALILDSDPASDQAKIHGVPVRYAGSAPARMLQEAGLDWLVLPPNRRLTPSEKAIVADCERAGVQVSRLELTVKPLPRGQAAAAASS